MSSGCLASKYTVTSRPSRQAAIRGGHGQARASTTACPPSKSPVISESLARSIRLRQFNRLCACRTPSCFDSFIAILVPACTNSRTVSARPALAAAMSICSACRPGNPPSGWRDSTPSARAHNFSSPVGQRANSSRQPLRNEPTIFSATSIAKTTSFSVCPANWGGTLLQNCWCTTHCRSC